MISTAAAVPRTVASATATPPTSRVLEIIPVTTRGAVDHSHGRPSAKAW